MLKRVQIIEKLSGDLIAEYPVVLEIADASVDDYCDEAWENAIDDGLVKECNKDDYEIIVVEKVPRE